MLRYIADGLSNSEIAATLTLSPTLVNNHLAAILRKHGVHSRCELISRHESDEELESC